MRSWFYQLQERTNSGYQLPRRGIVQGVRSAGDNAQLAVGQQLCGSLRPALRNNRIFFSSDDQCASLNMRQLLFDRISQRHLDRRPGTANASSSIIRTSDPTQGRLLAAGVDDQTKQLSPERSSFRVHSWTLKNQPIDALGVAESKFDENLATERIRHEVSFRDSYSLHPFGQSICKLRQIQYPSWFMTFAIARQVGRVDIAKLHQLLGGGNHVTARDDQAVDQDNDGRNRRPVRGCERVDQAGGSLCPPAYDFR